MLYAGYGYVTVERVRLKSLWGQANPQQLDDVLKKQQQKFLCHSLLVSWGRTSATGTQMVPASTDGSWLVHDCMLHGRDGASLRYRQQKSQRAQTPWSCPGHEGCALACDVREHIISDTGADVLHIEYCPFQVYVHI